MWGAIILLLAPLAVFGQQPVKARRTVQPVAQFGNFSGRVVLDGGRPVPGDATPLTFLSAQSEQDTKRFVVYFEGAHSTTVTRKGVQLTRSQIIDALNLEGLRVDVEFNAKLDPETNSCAAYKVDIGVFEMPNDSTGIPADLMIEEIEIGTGAEAVAGKQVTVHYTGWLTDGTKFDSSKDHNEPFSFKLGARQVISGWDRGVSGMKIGGKRKLVIPPDLGYGASGAGGVIPPNAVLVFEVELLGVK